jgi:NADPH:quinone reductase-like Zn-dependent oxidoreductase
VRQPGTCLAAKTHLQLAISNLEAWVSAEQLLANEPSHGVKDRPARPRSVSMSSSLMQGERVLITGGAGAVGSNLVDLVVRSGAHEIVVVDNFVRGRHDNHCLGSRKRPSPRRHGRHPRS